MGVRDLFVANINYDASEADLRARSCGYWAMRDPTQPEDVVLYDGSCPDKIASKPAAKALTRLARIV